MFTRCVQEIRQPRSGRNCCRHKRQLNVVPRKHRRNHWLISKSSEGIDSNGGSNRAKMSEVLALHTFPDLQFYHPLTVRSIELFFLFYFLSNKILYYLRASTVSCTSLVNVLDVKLVQTSVVYGSRVYPSSTE